LSRQGPRELDELDRFIEPQQCAAIAVSKSILGSDDDEGVNIERSEFPVSTDA
jgi:hypothetical protein